MYAYFKNAIWAIVYVLKKFVILIMFDYRIATEGSSHAM